MKHLKIMLLASALLMCACNSNSQKDLTKQWEAGNILAGNQPTPSDISYSLERYNLLRRAYWVNGLKEKAMAVARPSEVPLGYCVLFTESGKVIGQFAVDGKVTSLNSYLTPSTQPTGSGGYTEIPDVDGAYGSNDNGIFFFTPQWQYIEWSGIYLYSDTPFSVSDTVLGEY